MMEIIIKMGIGSIVLGGVVLILYLLFTIGRLWYLALKDLKDFDGL